MHCEEVLKDAQTQIPENVSFTHNKVSNFFFIALKINADKMHLV